MIFGEHAASSTSCLARAFVAGDPAGLVARAFPPICGGVARLGRGGHTANLRAVLDLCGPPVYTLEGCWLRVQMRATALDHAPAGRGGEEQSFVFDHLAGKLLTRDNLRSMSGQRVRGPFPDVSTSTVVQEAVVPQTRGASPAAATRFATTQKVNAMARLTLAS